MDPRNQSRGWAERSKNLRYSLPCFKWLMRRDWRAGQLLPQLLRNLQRGLGQALQMPANCHIGQGSCDHLFIKETL